MSPVRLLGHPALADAAVIGRPSAVLREELQGKVRAPERLFSRPPVDSGLARAS